MPTGKTLHEHLADYLDYKLALNFSPETMKTVRRNCRAFFRWLVAHYEVTTADRLRKTQLEHWQKHLAAHQTRKGTPLKAKSINKSVESVRGFLKYLVYHGHVPVTLVEALQYVKEPKTLPGSVLTHAEVRKLLRRMDTTTPEGHRDRAMLELLYSSGIRVGELLGLDVEGVDLGNAAATVTGKGKKDRVVPIGRTALRYLESYIVAVRPFLMTDRTERALFLHRGKRIGYQRLLRIIHAAAARVGIEKQVSPHTFRRSCTTELIRGNANLYHVKELLGHETLATLKHYAKLTILDLKKTHAKCHPREREDRR